MTRPLHGPQQIDEYLLAAMPSSRAAAMTSADCTGFGTCTNAAGQPRRPNACVDESSSPADGTICAAVGSGKGECPEGPVNQHCQVDIFRGCSMDIECPQFPANPEEGCGIYGRACFPGTGAGIGDTIGATGSPGDPRNHNTAATVASVFCMAPTGSLAVNAVFGFPGPGRLQLGGVGAENGTSAACPTRASFLPTSRGGALELGWTGLGHDINLIGDGKVTVAVSGCSNPGGFASNNCGVCTYTGPIANPNAVP